MTQPNEKEWLPRKYDFFVVYRNGDKYSTITCRSDNALQMLEYLVKENELTPESIISITKIGGMVI